MKQNLLALVLGWLIVYTCHAQTNTLYGNQTEFDASLPVQGNVVLTCTYPASPRTVNGVLISSGSKVLTLNANGEFWVTNVIFGTYSAVFDSGLTLNFNVLTNTLGSNNIANLMPPPAAVFPPPYFVLNGSSTIFITVTNGPGISILPLITNVNFGITNVTYQFRTN